MSVSYVAASAKEETYFYVFFKFPELVIHEMMTISALTIANRSKQYIEAITYICFLYTDSFLSMGL